MSLYKRGKVYYMDTVVSGQRIAKSTGKKTKREALQVEKQEVAKAQVQDGTAGGQMLLSELFEDIYKERWQYQRSGNRTYQRAMKLVQDYGDPSLNNVTTAWVRQTRHRMNRLGLSGATINRYLAHLRTALNHARDELGAIEQVPKISLMAERKGRTRVLSVEEQEKLTHYLRYNHPAKQSSKRTWPIVADLVDFLCETGLRLSEALNLSTKNFKGRSEITLTPGETKTASARTVPLTDKARAVLDRRGWKKPFPLNKDQVDRIFALARKHLGIDDPDFCVHACRHTYASRMLSSGRVQLYHIKTLLGHTSWSTTERYSHFATQDLHEAVAVLNG